MKKQNKIFSNLAKASTAGITLIALVITIVVLLILAGVSLSMVLGDNGIISKAKQAQTATQASAIQEALDIAVTELAIGKYSGDLDNSELVDNIITKLKNQNLVDDNQISTDADGKTIITIGDTVIDVEEQITSVDSDTIQIGDYIEYNPKVADKSGTLVDENSLTYISPVGAIPSTETESHGNGYGEQTFTVADNTKWRVFNIDEKGRIELISANVINPNNSESFFFKGAIGYLYAEEELNNACSIFGHGYGVDTTVGARSINIDDINKKAGFSTDEDFKTINPNYGTPPTTNIYYPTLDSTSTTNPGISATPTNSFTNTYYVYYKDKIASTKTKELLSTGSYWLSSTCENVGETLIGFSIRRVDTGATNTSMHANAVCTGNSSTLSALERSASIRPIVTLQSNIQLEKSTESDNTWIIK